MAMRGNLNGLKVLKGLSEALVSVHRNDSRADGASIKRKVAAAYDSFALGAEVFWNWGMFHEGIDQKLASLLRGYDKSKYDWHSEQLYFYTLDKVPRPERRPRRILEVGCGAGMGLNFLSRTEGGSEFTGLDLSPECVERANARFGRPGSLTYVQGDAENLPCGANEFDVVLNVESSHNYPDLRRFFGEVARVLRPGGYFSMVDVFTEPRRAHFESCRADGRGELEWIEENDISEYVKAAIRRRIEPGSPLRDRLMMGHSFLYRATMTPLLMRMYGSRFVDPQSLRIGRRELEFSSYRHFLARKRS